MPDAVNPSDPLWLAHRYDPVRDAVHFRRLSREGHRAATFLTDEEIGVGDPVPVPRARAAAAAGSAAPIHFIFHSAFCCSTLLARAFDIEGVSMGLKEPVILNDLVGWRQRGGDARPVSEALGAALTLLARPFSPGEAVVVKPSNVVNAFAPAMLAMRPGAGALLLHAPLATFIASVAKKGMWGRLWVRDLLVKQLKDGLVDLGFTPEDHLGQTDLQVAAVGWLAQQALFARLVDRFGPERVRTLDSETLVTEPGRVLEALARLYGLALDGRAIAAVVEGPVFRRHSKLAAAFDAADRDAEHGQAVATHGDEIGKIVVWAEAVARTAGVPLRLPAPLLT